MELPRWLELQEMARQMIGDTNVSDQLPELPELLSRQRERFENPKTSSVT